MLVFIRPHRKHFTSSLDSDKSTWKHEMYILSAKFLFGV